MGDNSRPLNKRINRTKVVVLFLEYSSLLISKYPSTDTSTVLKLASKFN